MILVSIIFFGGIGCFHVSPGGSWSPQTSPCVLAMVQTDPAKKTTFCGWLTCATILAGVSVQINFWTFLVSKKAHCDFELTWDPKDTEVTEGVQRSLCLFYHKLLQYGCLQTWDPKDTEVTEGVRKSHCLVLPQTTHGCLQTPLGPSNQDLSFWSDLLKIPRCRN